MAKFNILVEKNVEVNNKPTTSNSIDNLCETQLDVTVKVPSGETRYVRITSFNKDNDTNPNTTAPLTETISSEKTYTLFISGDQSTGSSEFDTVTILVSANSSSGAFYSKSITRKHSGNIC